MGDDNLTADDDLARRRALAEALGANLAGWIPRDDERSEFEKLYYEAKAKGWKLPVNRALPAATWIWYWQAMLRYEADPSGGRPVVPHRSA